MALVTVWWCCDLGGCPLCFPKPVPCLDDVWDGTASIHGTCWCPCPGQQALGAGAQPEGAGTSLSPAPLFWEAWDKAQPRCRLHLAALGDTLPAAEGQRVPPLLFAGKLRFNSLGSYPSILAEPPGFYPSSSQGGELGELRSGKLKAENEIFFYYYYFYFIFFYSQEHRSKKIPIYHPRPSETADQET